METAACKPADAKFEASLETALQLKQELDTIKVDKKQVESNPPSRRAKGFPPSPVKAALVVDTDADNALLTDHADDASNFLSWEELPQDVCGRMKAREDKLTVQTSSSPNRFQNDLTVEAVSCGEVKQREWNFVLFLPTDKKICMPGSGFKLNLQPCPKEEQKPWSTQFPKMEKGPRSQS